MTEQDGSKVIMFTNGTKKTISSDGKSTSFYFFNGDVKHIKADQTVVSESRCASSSRSHLLVVDPCFVFLVSFQWSMPQFPPVPNDPCA